MTDALPSGEILELIKGQARLETKLDQFFSTQTAMKTEIDTLKVDIGTVKTDLAEIKVQRRITKGYISFIVAGVSLVAGVVGQFIDPLMKKLFGV